LDLRITTHIHFKIPETSTTAPIKTKRSRRNNDQELHHLMATAITVVFGLEGTVTTALFKTRPPKTVWPWPGSTFSDVGVDHTARPVLNDVSNTHPPMWALAMLVFQLPGPENMHSGWVPFFDAAQAWIKENRVFEGYDWERSVDMTCRQLIYII